MKVFMVMLSSHVPGEPAIENRLKSRPHFYTLEHPGPEHVFLVVEVLDSSVSDDREVNVPHYARFGIPETWLVDEDVVIDNKHGQDSPVGIKIPV